MNSKDIYNFVVNLFVELFDLDKEQITPDTTLFDELGLDSLDMVDLAVEMQSRFGFKIERIKDEEKFRSVRTIKDLCLLIEEKIDSSEINLS